MDNYLGKLGKANPGRKSASKPHLHSCKVLNFRTNRGDLIQMLLQELPGLLHAFATPQVVVVMMGGVGGEGVCLTCIRQDETYTVQLYLCMKRENQFTTCSNRLLR